MRTALNEVLLPLVSRIGAFVSGVLVANGADATMAQQVEIGVAALVLIGVDLVVRRVYAKKG